MAIKEKKYSAWVFATLLAIVLMLCVSFAGFYIFFSHYKVNIEANKEKSQ